MNPELEQKLNEANIEIERLNIIIKRAKLTVLASVIIGLCILTFSALNFWFSKTDYTAYFDILNTENFKGLNDLGDFLAGSVGIAWSLSGIILIYLAFLGQKQQLIQQKVEILLTRDEIQTSHTELKGQKDQMIAQNKTLSIQRFENTFFQLLNGYQDILKHLNSLPMNGEYFKRLKENLFSHHLKHSPSLNIDDQFNTGITAYKSLYSAYGSNLSYYFTFLYRIFKFISESNLEEKDKSFYSKVMRARLSPDELELIYYNAFTENGSNFKALINEFNILKHLEPFNLLEFQSLNYLGLDNIEVHRSEHKENRELFFRDFNASVQHIIATARNGLKDTTEVKRYNRGASFSGAFDGNEYKWSVEFINPQDADKFVVLLAGSLANKELLILFMKQIVRFHVVSNNLGLKQKLRDVKIQINPLKDGEILKKLSIIVSRNDGMPLHVIKDKF